MNSTLQWNGIEYDSVENCVVTTTGDGTEIRSVISGKYGNDVYRVDYLIRTNSRWETVFFEVKSKINDTLGLLVYEGDGKGNWKSNGNPAPEFKGCIDIDIPLTPFTNTLPINRLKLKEGASAHIKVIYIDLLEEHIHAVHQKYTRLSHTDYQYENVPNDFEATITVDESGFVMHYPTLFTRDLSNS